MSSSSSLDSSHFRFHVLFLPKKEANFNSISQESMDSSWLLLIFPKLIFTFVSERILRISDRLITTSRCSPSRSRIKYPNSVATSQRWILRLKALNMRDPRRASSAANASGRPMGGFAWRIQVDRSSGRQLLSTYLFNSRGVLSWSPRDMRSCLRRHPYIVRNREGAEI